MDYDALRDGLMQAIPYNRHLGLEILEIGDGEARVRLPDAEHLNNHVGSQHAGGLFSAAEAASGAAFVGAFAERLGEITPLAKAARIDYLKLAKGPIDANARLDATKDELLSKLDEDGRVEFPVQVVLNDEDGNTVAEVTVDWHVKKDS